MAPNDVNIHPHTIGNVIASKYSLTGSSSRHETVIKLGCEINAPGLLCSDNQVFINQESIVEDEAPLFDLPVGIKFPFATIMFISLSIGSYFKFVLYRFMYSQKKDTINRPINVLTLTSAIIHHVTHFSIGTEHALVCIIDTPLVAYVGDTGCWMMVVFGVFGLVYLSVGSFGIAIYRTLYIRHNYLVKYVIGERTLLLIVLILSIGLSGSITLLYTIEDNPHRTGINMCTGLSVTETELLMQYHNSIGNEQITTTHLGKLTTLSCITLQLIEFALYLSFFLHRYKNDNGSIAKFMKQEDVRQRNAKNAGTFLGQFYGFIVEYSFLVSILSIHIFYADVEYQHIRGLIVMAKFIDFGLLSAIEVYSSPVLKSFMNSKN